MYKQLGTSPSVNSYNQTGECRQSIQEEPLELTIQKSSTSSSDKSKDKGKKQPPKTAPILQQKKLQNMPKRQNSKTSLTCESPSSASSSNRRSSSKYSAAAKSPPKSKNAQRNSKNKQNHTRFGLKEFSSKNQNMIVLKTRYKIY